MSTENERRDYALRIIKVLEHKHTCHRCPGYRVDGLATRQSCILCREVAGLSPYYSAPTVRRIISRDAIEGRRELTAQEKEILFVCPCLVLGPDEAVKRAWIWVEEVLGPLPG